MNDKVDCKYYDSANWRNMRGCSNCAGYDPGDFCIGGINQCNNGKDNINGTLYNCDVWAPNFEQGLIDRVASLEAENAELRERTRWIPVGERLPDVYRDEENRELIPFLVCVHEEGYPFRAVYDGKGWGDGAFKTYPTHWMPLPAAPKEDE